MEAEIAQTSRTLAPAPPAKDPEQAKKEIIHSLKEWIIDASTSQYAQHHMYYTLQEEIHELRQVIIEMRKDKRREHIECQKELSPYGSPPVDDNEVETFVATHLERPLPEKLPDRKDETLVAYATEMVQLNPKEVKHFICDLHLNSHRLSEIFMRVLIFRVAQRSFRCRDDADYNSRLNSMEWRYRIFAALEPLFQSLRAKYEGEKTDLDD